MAKPDYIPTGKKWNDQRQCFQDLDKEQIDDLQVLLDEAKARIATLELLVKDMHNQNKEIAAKILPEGTPELLASLNLKVISQAMALEAKAKEADEERAKQEARIEQAYKSVEVNANETEAKIQDYKKMAEESAARAYSFEQQVKELEAKNKEILIKTSPPEMAARYSALFQENEALRKQLDIKSRGRPKK